MPTAKKKRPAPKSRTAPKSRKKKPPAITNTTATRQRAIRELGINVPIYRTRIVGGRLELHCYGGQVLLWPVPASPPPPGGNEGGQ